MGWVIESHPDFDPGIKPGEKIYPVDPVPESCVRAGRPGEHVWTTNRDRGVMRWSKLYSEFE